MKCLKCQHDNPSGAETCGSCAASLARPCLRCGANAPATARFCADCGFPVGRTRDVHGPSRFNAPESYTPKHLADRILTHRTDLEGERKLVTVLFADIANSMEMVADRDPEEARKLVDPVIERMMDAVHYFEGTVSKIMGDGILALFGAPLAHEDHAVRACYAALRMQEAVTRYADEVQRSHGTPVTIRIGLNSGEIVVGAIGNDLYMDYAVIGHTAHLAARMEQMARPGSVLTTAETIRLAEGYVAVKPLGPMPVRGLGYSVDVFEVTGGSLVRTKLQAAARRGLSPFVGRDAEIAAMRETLRLARDGTGQLVAVVGDPGVGKSRLIHEFVQSYRMDDCLILETNATSYGHAASYLPVIELLKQYFKIDRRDTSRVIREKVTGKIMTLDAALPDVIPPILDLLDALDAGHPFQSLDPLQHRLYTYQAVTRLLLSETRVQPLVTVFEDLHWNDSLTLGLLNELIIAAPQARLLVLITYRPEFKDEWQAQPTYRQLRLDPLSVESFSELLEALLGTHESLPDLGRFLLDRSGGNPFFVEEIVRALVDTGALEGERGAYRLARPFASINIPPTVQAVLAARIDALPPDEKRLLQETAVIGLEAPFALIQEISGQPHDSLRRLLPNLQDAGFLFATQLFPDLQYAFKHSLTHDVAYAGLLNERRRDIHARIVGVIEELWADRLGEQIERLADHALRGHLHEKAVHYLRQAGTRAADREAYLEAATLFEEALEALAQLPTSDTTLEQAIDIRFELRNVLQPLGDRKRIIVHLREAQAAADRLGDRRRIGWVQSYLTEHYWMLGRYADSMAAGEHALAVATELSDLPLQVVTNMPLGLAYHTRGDYPRAMTYFRSNITLLRDERLMERYGMFVIPAAFSRSFVAWSLAETGQFVESAELGEEALRIAQEAEHPFSCGYAYMCLGVAFLRQGRLRRALRSFELAMAAGAFADSPVGFAYVALHLGYTLALAGRAGEGIPFLEKSVAVAEAKGFAARHSLRLAYLGETYLLAGRDADAAAVVPQALDLARRRGERANEAYALRVLGKLSVRHGRPAEAAHHFHAALDLSGELGMRPLQAHCHLEIASTGVTIPGSAAANTHQDLARTMARAMQLQFWGDL